ncbi:MAG: hypothetical protein AUI14_13285 [Actinobacteria bacterium 13_2_20CM_2_71_6]|nr:MAG: hypothetical protein AUI14_13285 [Actinobacteria bacterium 13_2_20CM_2_71_6]
MAGVTTVPELARLLRQLRRRDARQRGAAELTYRELAAKTGWSHGIVGQYFAGRTLPPTDRFDTLIRLLGATAAEQGALATARDRVEEHRRRSAERGDGSATGARVAGVIPRQLPAAVRHFAGRSAELDALTRGLDQQAVVVATIDGTAGIGKTALAVYWARQVADRFPDGQLYANMRGFDATGSPLTPSEAVRGFLDALDVAPGRIPDSIDAQVGMYRSLLAGLRMLLVFDNARDAEQVRPLLPGSPGCLVVVTSRTRLTSLVTAAGAQPLTLDLLSTADARELLVRRLGPARVAAEPHAVTEIITWCARLPLALSVVASRAATHPGFPLAALAFELRNPRGGLDALAGGDPATDVRAAFSWSYRQLPADAARLFRLLGLHPGPDIGTAAAASLAGIPASQVRELLTELARAHLVTEHAPGRFSFHALLRAYATELVYGADSADERRSAVRRLRAYGTSAGG